MKKRNLFKIAALTAVFALGSMFANAQTNPAVPSPIPPVKLIDNKGTVKYLQSNNGLTTVTENVASGVQVTWKLGGRLMENTYIDVNGLVFGLDNLEIEIGDAATSSTTAEAHGGSGSGWTLLVRDEETGAIKKMLATDLIQSGHELFVASANQTVYDLTTTGDFLPNFNNVYVYRNGAKLIAGVDYNITDGDTFTLTNTGPETATFEPYTIFAGDRIEIHYIK